MQINKVNNCFTRSKVERATWALCLSWKVLFLWRHILTEFVAVAGGRTAGVVCALRWRFAIGTTAKPRVLAVLLHGDRICYGKRELTLLTWRPAQLSILRLWRAKLIFVI